MNGKVSAISISNAKGVKKRNVPDALLVEEHGIQGDAHAGQWPRQVSLLALESIDRAQARGAVAGPGDFAENITTSGVELGLLTPGDRLQIGRDAVVEVTQLGKECHEPCEIGRAIGKCIMPEEGVFARVISGGRIRVNDTILLLSKRAAMNQGSLLGNMLSSDDHEG